MLVTLPENCQELSNVLEFVSYRSVFVDSLLTMLRCSNCCPTLSWHSVIFVNENENQNGEKRENNEFVNEN